MNYVDSFYNFTPNDGSINFEELFTFNENRTSAKYSKDEFKDLFRDSLMESDGYADEEILENAHAHYELGMLYEAKSHWFESNVNFNYLDCESHIILIKEGEGYIIDKSTFTRSKSINEGEGFWSDPMGSISAGWQKVKSVAKAVVKKTVSTVKDGWDKLSYGAKKAWEFVKTCGKVIVEFVKGMTMIEWAALTMSVLSAILGILGGIAAGSVAFSVAAPALTATAGVFQGVGGILHIYEGFMKYKHSVELINKANVTLTPMSKVATVAIKVLPEFTVGGCMLLLGINDIVKGATTMINPAGGAESVATNTAAKAGAKNAVKEFKPGAAIEHKIQDVGVKVVKSMGIDIAKEESKEAVGKVLTTIVTTVSSAILSGVLGWVWEGILKIGQGITKGIDFMLNIPKKISSIIESFNKKAEGTFLKMIAKGLNTLVKPMTDAAAKVISKYIQPIVDSVKRFFTRELESYKQADKLLGELKKELHGHGSKHAPPKPSGKTEIPNAPKHKIDADKVKKSDVKVIKKAVAKSKGKEVDKKKKVKESLVWERKHVQSFDDLNFI